MATYIPAVFHLKDFLATHSARTISESPTSRVFHCNPVEEPPFVLKAYVDESTHTSQLLRCTNRFSREVSVLSRLSHPNIVGLRKWGWFEDTQTPFVIQEFAPGLPANIAAKQLSLDRLLSIAVQLARTVEFCHRRGVIHGNLIPDNILIDPSVPPTQDVFTLLDFAGSRLAHTRSTTTSLDLVSPHVATDHLTLDTNFASDIYSLGKLFQLLFHATQANRATGSSQAAPITRDLAPVIARMVSDRAASRQSSAGRVASDLADIARANGVATSDFTLAPYVRSAIPAGFDAILQQFADLLAHARSASHLCHYVQLVGPLGSGKSSLAREIASLCANNGFCVETMGEDSSVTRAILASTSSRPRLVISNTPLDNLPQLPRDMRVPLLFLSFAEHALSPTDRPLLADCARTFTAFHLAPLTTADLRSSLHSTLGLSDTSSSIASTLLAWSGGSPLLAWECMHHWIDSGQLHLSSDLLLQSASSLDVPAGAIAGPARILDTVGTSDFVLLEILLACHGPVSADVLAHATGQPSEQVLPTLARLCATGAVATSGHAHRYAVSSLAVRGELRRRVDLSRQSDLSRKVGNALLATASSLDDTNTAAHQFAQSGDTERASMLFLQVGKEHCKHNRLPDSVDALRLALSSGALPTNDRYDTHDLLVSLLLRLGLFQDALSLDAAITSLRDAPAAFAVRTHLRRAEIAYSIGQYSDASRYARMAKRIAHKRGTHLDRLQATILLGQSLCWLEKRTEGRTLLYRAGCAARRLHEPTLAAFALRDIASSLWKEGSRAAAYWYERRRMSLFRKAGRTTSVASSLQNLGILSMDAGRYARARDYYRLSFRYAGRHMTASVRGAGLINLAETYRSEGLFRIAATAIRHGIPHLVLTGEAQRTGVAHSNMAQILAQAGYPRECRRLLIHALGRPEVRTSPTLRCSLLHAWSDYFLSVGRTGTAAKVASMMVRTAHDNHLDGTLLEGKVVRACALVMAGNVSQALSLLMTATRVHRHTGSSESLHFAQVLLLTSPDPLTLSPLGTQALNRLMLRLRKKGLRRHEGMVALTMGATVLVSDGPTKAYRLFLRALEIAHTCANRRLRWEAQYWLGRASEKALRTERALAWYRRALSLVHEIDRDLSGSGDRSSFMNQVHVRDLVERTEHLTVQVRTRRHNSVRDLQALERRTRRMLSSLGSIGNELSSILDLPLLQERILDTSMGLVQAERAAFFLLDEATDRFELHCVRSRHGARGQPILDHSTIQNARAGNTVLTSAGGNTESGFRPGSGQGIESVLCVPMRVRQKVIGAIYLDSPATSSAFGERERAYVESLASQAAVAIENALLFGQMKAENLRLHREVDARFKEVIGSGLAMRKVQQVMVGVLNNDSTVLLTGESGTGKGMVARAIHGNSHRQGGPFIAVDCGALPENLLEAELFGYRRGAFTGADRERIGLIEEARGGTLFLDEIGNTSAGLQARLLRVLQEKEIRRLGENEARPVNVRIIAATNADLRTLMIEGRFRHDLFYRLNVVSIEVPALRSRIEDLTALVNHFLRRHAVPHSTPKRLAPGVLRAFGQYHWPGNVRELEHVIERLILLTPGEFITVDDLPDEIRPGPSESHLSENLEQGPKRISKLSRSHAYDSPKTGEQIMIEDALRRYAGDKAKAARFIGWNRQKLYRRMRSFGIAATFGRKAA